MTQLTKVWIVMHYDYDDVCVLGVFTTPDLAQHYINSFPEIDKYYRRRSNLGIEEVEVKNDPTN